MRALADGDPPAIATAALYFAYYWCAARHTGRPTRLLAKEV